MQHTITNPTIRFSGRFKRSLKALTTPLLAFSAALSLSSCDSSSKKSTTTNSLPGQQVVPEESADLIKVTFTYGSEKKKWVDAATRAFNAKKHKTSAGRVIFVEHIPMGSGECISEIQNGLRKAHIVSPASEAFIKLGNAESQAKTSTNLVKKTENLCLSPVVIAMWEPMAKALGHGTKPIGWSEIHHMAQNPQGWAAHGMGQWGQFRFGHTHPDYSNSGLISLIAEVYAGAQKQARLTVADVQKPEVGNYLEGIEKAVVHYGKSTGFFGRKMFDAGPGYLSAAVLYENMVIESRQRTDLPFPVVAVYPKEGTFWSDHPAGIVNREWVDAEHEEAARTYLDFLLSEDQQRAVMTHGFRPADASIPLSDIFSAKNGVDPKQPLTTLEVPTVEVINEIRQLWVKKKKKAHVILAIDRSGSMNADNKIGAAKQGAKEMIKMLGDEDHFSLITFSGKANWAIRGAPVGTSRQKLISSIDSLFASGKTSLYDAISLGFSHFEASKETDRITAIVVLSDGGDTASRTKLNRLIRQISSDGESKNTRVFTIAYGSGAESSVLKKIAEATRAKQFKGDQRSISEVFKEISTFF